MSGWLYRPISNPNACSPLTGDINVQGKVVVIDRGDCLFTTKVLNAQSAGAIAAIVVDTIGVCPSTGVVGSPACGPASCSGCPGTEANPACQCFLRYMADDGSGSNVNIPSFMVTGATNGGSELKSAQTRRLAAMRALNSVCGQSIFSFSCYAWRPTRALQITTGRTSSRTEQRKQILAGRLLHGISRLQMALCPGLCGHTQTTAQPQNFAIRSLHTFHCSRIELRLCRTTSCGTGKGRVATDQSIAQRSAYRVDSTARSTLMAICSPVFREATSSQKTYASSASIQKL